MDTHTLASGDDGVNPILTAALRYAGRGWHVLPLVPGGKAPIGSLAARGVLDASIEAETIQGWWGNEPTANVGIRTGAISGLFVLDVDPRHYGDDSLRELEHRHGKLPDTVMALTGGGGCHVYFAHPCAGMLIRNAVGFAGLPGLDVRGDGGYVVAPPSRHPSGRLYYWELSSHPDDVSVAAAPGWLLEIVCAPPTRKSEPDGTTQIHEGARNATLASFAGSMRRRGMTEEAILAGLLEENERRCDPPLARAEVERIARSISRYEPAASLTSTLGKRSQATRLIDLTEAELFRTPSRVAFATFSVNGHRETWPVKSRALRSRLAQQFYEKAGAVPSGQTLQDVLAVLEGRALFDGAELPVFIRVAEQEGAVYVDMGTEDWAAIKITPLGWEVVTDPPVRFRRTPGMAPLPYPVPGGRLDELRPFVNVVRGGDWVLFVAWLLGAFRQKGPYPILVLHGEQGSAKSTVARIVRSVVDPHTLPLRAEPRDARDVMIAAANGWCLAFDNLSSLAPWFSDMLCRLSTGGGFATRELYTDADEVLFDAQRPVILNGIEELASQGDLLDRVLILDLPPIPEEQRRTEARFWREFEEARPRILGAFLDAVSGALRNLPAVVLPRLPRMADFAVWATAAEGAIGWPPGTFLTAYAGSREQSDDAALEASLVAVELRTLVARGTWEGIATDLLKALNEQAEEPVRRLRGWPTTPRALTNALRRLIPNLRAVGIHVEFRREPGGARRRKITIRTTGQSFVPTVPSVPGGNPPDATAPLSPDDPLPPFDSETPPGRERDSRDAWDATNPPPSGDTPGGQEP